MEVAVDMEETMVPVVDMEPVTAVWVDMVANNRRRKMIVLAPPIIMAILSVILEIIPMASPI